MGLNKGLLPLFILASLFPVSHAQTSGSKANLADIVFLVDSCSSIGEANFQRIKQFLHTFIAGLDVEADRIRVGMVQFSNNPHKEFLLGAYANKNDLLEKVNNLNHLGGESETGKALRFILSNYFTKEGGSRVSQNVPQIVVVITDEGTSTNMEIPDVENAARDLWEKGVLIFGIGVGDDSFTQLQSITNKPYRRFLLSFTDYQEMLAAANSIRDHVGIILDGQRQALDPKFVDVFVLVDSSATQDVIQLLRRLADQLNLGMRSNRMALAQFGRDVKIEFSFDGYETKNEALNLIDQFKLKSDGQRELGKALTFVHSYLQNPASGSRIAQGYKQYMLVMSAGVSDDSVFKAARELQNERVSIVNVDLSRMSDLPVFGPRGPRPRPSDRKDIITSPEKTFYATSGDDRQVVQNVKTAITEDKIIVSEDCKSAPVADIVFIVDVTDSDTAVLLRDFLHNVIQGLQIKSDSVQVGMVLCNEEPKAEFDLNEFNSKAEILHYIKMLPLTVGKSYIGRALKLAREELFTSRRGSRSHLGVQQVAVVITDSTSLDDVRSEAAKLRLSQVHVYALGVNETQMKEVASFPADRFMLIMESFRELYKMDQLLRNILCNNILLSAVGKVRTYNIKQGCSEKEEADIYFVIDSSSSIGWGNYAEMKIFIREFLKMFTIGPRQVRVGAVIFSNTPSLEFGLTEHNDRTSVENAVDTIKYTGGDTYIGEALRFVTKRFQNPTEMRDTKVPRFLIVLTDGESHDEVTEPAAQLRAQDVSIFAIGVKGANITELRNIAGDERKMFYVDDFDKLRPVKNEIATRICSDDVCSNKVADVIFLVSGSETIKNVDFRKTKAFINTMISKFKIGKDDIQVGVVQFSSQAKVEFALNKFDDKNQVQQAINSMIQLMGGTKIGAALRYVSQYFGSPHGARSHAPKFLVMVTDGMSQDDVAVAAKALRNKGIIIYAIGIGAFNTMQLREISGNQDNFHMVMNFDRLIILGEELVLRICNAAKACQKSAVADVVFLVDGSTSIHEADFKRVKSFMISVVNSTSVGPENVRFCTILFASTCAPKFSLQRYVTKRDVQNAINNLDQPTGNTETAMALECSLKYFGKSEGGRKADGVPQIMFIITDGEATRPKDVPNAANEVHKLGVSVFAIGVGNVKLSELETITRDRSKVYLVENFKALETLQVNVSKDVCKNAKSECLTKETDLVMLIDTSESTTYSNVSWKAMQHFLLTFVDSLHIQQDLSHVGVAQFSSTYSQEIQLTYDAMAVKSAIKAITRRNEETSKKVHIGNALNQVQSFFHLNNGSRIGVPHKVLLITAANSDDSVVTAANRLRGKGIEVFVVGIGDISFPLLKQIAGPDKRIVRVKNFAQLTLPQTTQLVVNTICGNIPEEQSGCTVDIGVGFDISRASSQYLLSSQYKLQTYLPEIIRYVATMPKLCCLSNHTLEANVGFRLVARDGKILYDTTIGEYRAAILNKVMTQLRTTELTFNGQLLQSFQKKMSASNAGVKVVIIFTDGLDASTEELKLASEKLSESGVHALLTVALEGIQNTAELEKLEFGRGFGYKQPLMIGMQNVGIAIQKQIYGVASRECCGLMCQCTGQDGLRGYRGIPGLKGPPGQNGYAGFPGEEGEAGDRGPPGLNGTRGHRGCPGRRGHKGVRGYTGDSGEDGGIGLDGVNGEPGVTGSGGSPGVRGNPGSPGKKGTIGIPGDPGQKGIRGDPGESGINNNFRGPKGEAGYPGMQGDAGPDGSPGRPGDAGLPGLKGRRGPAGLPGVIGPGGDRGLRGIPGAPGPMGIIGPNGAPGQIGIPGLPGPQGAPGTQGDPGMKGSIGPRGQKGQPGDPGDKGAVGPPGSRGVPGNDGPDGFGVQGPKGKKGDPGFPGYPGLQGEIGDTGTTGYNGTKGRRGRGGDAGRQGAPGTPGDPGSAGHRGAKGPPGNREMSTCQLISYIRNNCVCCKDKGACPSYPTELVIGLDMSDGVDNAQFERMRSAILSLLDNINIVESNCPTGARVAVVSYSANTKYLIRFTDHRHKKQLVEAVKNIALERTVNKRNIGAAMRFVGRNVFKRVRQGKLMKKVAIFLSGGESQDETSMTTAILEYKALDINLGLLAFNNTRTPKIERAFQADEAKRFVLSVMKRQKDEQALKKILQCVICYDQCNPAAGCPSNDQPVAQGVELDLALLVDGSRSILADQYEGVKQVLSTVLDQLEVRRQISSRDNPARVALYQQSSSYSEAQAPVKQIFTLQQFHDRNLMKQSIFNNLTQTGGSSRLGHAMEFVINRCLLNAPRPRSKKMVVVIVGEETEYYDKQKLDFISKLAKCQGVVVFILTVGNQFNSDLVEELASFPPDQHIVHLGQVKHDQQEYARRFIRTFLHILNGGMNTYPPQLLTQECVDFEAQTPQPDLEYAEVRSHVFEAAERTSIKRISVEHGTFSKEVEEGHLGEKEETTGSNEHTHILGSGYENEGLPTSEPGYSDAQCLLRMDHGILCGEYVQRWYYDSAVGACSPFWYGGCNGNTNRFSTEIECFQTCVANRLEELAYASYETTVEDVCLLKQDQGPCANYVLKWFFNREKNVCSFFWYGGCGGNRNRFNTKEECIAGCVKPHAI